MSLKRELTTYREHLSELALHEGRFVLIRGSEVVDTFSSYADALRQGYRQFGLEPFLVKQIQLVEQVQYVTRAITPHHVATSADFAAQGIDALIGRDVLRDCILIYNGSVGSFTLAF